MSLILASAIALLMSPEAAQGHSHSSMQGTGGQATVPRRTMVKTSSPADGAMLDGPPPAFEVTFVHAMALKSIELVDEKGAVIAVPAEPEVVDESSARVALPRLAPGTYHLKWLGAGAGGREMRGSLSFMVH